jgi:hypothetical protein
VFFCFLESIIFRQVFVQQIIKFVIRFVVISSCTVLPGRFDFVVVGRLLILAKLNEGAIFSAITVWVITTAATVPPKQIRDQMSSSTLGQDGYIVTP